MMNLFLNNFDNKTLIIHNLYNHHDINEHINNNILLNFHHLIVYIYHIFIVSLYLFNVFNNSAYSIKYSPK